MFKTKRQPIFIRFLELVDHFEDGFISSPVSLIKFVISLSDLDLNISSKLNGSLILFKKFKFKISPVLKIYTNRPQSEVNNKVRELDIPKVNQLIALCKNVTSIFVKLNINKVNTNLGNHNKTLNTNLVALPNPIKENKVFTKISELPSLISGFKIP
jgi:hypothetical protein